jgi:hypothetical protein
VASESRIRDWNGHRDVNFNQARGSCSRAGYEHARAGQPAPQSVLSRSWLADTLPSAGRRRPAAPHYPYRGNGSPAGGHSPPVCVKPRPRRADERDRCPSITDRPLRRAALVPPPPGDDDRHAATTSFAGALQGDAGLGTAAARRGTDRHAGSVPPLAGHRAGQAVLNLVRGSRQAEQPPHPTTRPDRAVPAGTARQRRRAVVRLLRLLAAARPACRWRQRQASAASTTSTRGPTDRQGHPRRQRPPQPGDLIVWDEHIGVVENVRCPTDASNHRGNSLDQVPPHVRQRRRRRGLVRLVESSRRAQDRHRSRSGRGHNRADAAHCRS